MIKFWLIIIFWLCGFPKIDGGYYNENHEPMRRTQFSKYLLNLLGVVLLVSACSGEVPSTVQPVEMVPDPFLEEPTATPFTEYEALPTPPVLIHTPEALPYPEWVTDFSDPILAKLANRRPDFQDDFKLVCIYNSQRLDSCPTEDEMPNFIDDLSVLNQGWFYRIPGLRSGPFYSDLKYETLFLTSPKGKTDKDLMVYNPYLMRENFVLSFDFQFKETEPEDIVRFQFSQTKEQSVNLDLVKNKSWSFYNAFQTNSGVFDYFPPELIHITIIMLGRECAVYFNDVPLDYLSDCRSAPVVGSFPWAVSFHVIAAQGRVATAAIDNVKLWDLDKIPSLR